MVSANETLKGKSPSSKRVKEISVLSSQSELEDLPSKISKNPTLEKSLALHEESIAVQKERFLLENQILASLVHEVTQIQQGLQEQTRIIQQGFQEHARIIQQGNQKQARIFKAAIKILKQIADGSRLE